MSLSNQLIANFVTIMHSHFFVRCLTTEDGADRLSEKRRLLTTDLCCVTSQKNGDTESYETHLWGCEMHRTGAVQKQIQGVLVACNETSISTQ